jgi:DNA-binding transcriptional ArsR family regulator
MTLSEVAAAFHLAREPTRAGILLELGEGPRDTTALAAAVGRGASQVSSDLTALRRAGLVETTPAGQRRVHTLTARGLVVCEALRKLAD